MGDRQTDDFTVYLRGNPELGFFECFSNRVDGGGIPWLNDQQARFRGGDSSQLFESHGGAVGFDPEILDKSGRSFARADALKILLHLAEGLFHFLLGFEKDVVGGHKGGVAQLEG